MIFVTISKLVYKLFHLFLVIYKIFNSVSLCRWKLLGENIHIMKKNTETLPEVSNEVGLEAEGILWTVDQEWVGFVWGCFKRTAAQIVSIVWRGGK
jgi:hypothetical protein